MIRADQIPDEVEEAAWNASGDNMKAAIAAAINAWPGVTHFPGMQRGFRETPPFITLPLPHKEHNG